MAVFAELAHTNIEMETLSHLAKFLFLMG